MDRMGGDRISASFPLLFGNPTKICHIYSMEKIIVRSMNIKTVRAGED